MSILGSDEPAFYPPAFNKMYESIYRRPRSYLQLLEDNRAFARRMLEKRIREQVLKKKGLRRKKN
jgi:hypothetical protein